MIKTVKRMLDRTLELLIITSTGVLLLDVIWQVFSRFVIRSPSSWTEEFATYLLMWVGLLGAALAVDKGAHLGVDVVVTRLSPPLRAGADVVVFFLIAVFSSLVMVGGGTMLVQRTLITAQVLPALGIRMGYVYLCLPLSGFFIAFYSCYHGFNRVKQFHSQKAASS